MTTKTICTKRQKINERIIECKQLVEQHLRQKEHRHIIYQKNTKDNPYSQIQSHERKNKEEKKEERDVEKKVGKTKQRNKKDRRKIEKKIVKKK